MAELERERRVFVANLAEWRRAHAGQFVLVHNDDVIGFFNSLSEAFNEGMRRYGLAPFLVQQVTPGDSLNVSFVGGGLLPARG